MTEQTELPKGMWIAHHSEPSKNALGEDALLLSARLMDGETLIFGVTCHRPPDRTEDGFSRMDAACRNEAARRAAIHSKQDLT
jgi:hypothetical protein